ncbi:MAG: U32 family peptidase [Methylacidiphilales bacterium]|nr:U32 family peptidase [Candidatus Methylacidiphilales bacterium]
MPHLNKPELLAPAGNWDCARAAVANGADAVYFGLPRFNARLRADNFTGEDLPELVRYLHERNVKAFVTLNTLVFTDELTDAEQYLIHLHRCGVDAAIVQDLGLVRLAHETVPGFKIHASTQMTLTSAEGLRFAKKLGVERAVLARELSLRELEKIQKDPVLPLEVFVHGALCVAYSGQCLTSEALGQRSANRGECAQACRLPYQLVVDDILRDLGDKRYLLSPQDLAAVDEIPRLIELGIASFKIEGRLKAPEYVAAVTQVYRKAIDACLAHKPQNQAGAPSTEDRYKLEMTFSRGLYSGWLNSVNHQQLVHARFGKKRGPLAGYLKQIGPDFVELDFQTELKPGDGIVFDTGGDTGQEQGGRIYQIHGARLYFEHDKIDFSQLKPGHRIWKTSDPKLERELRKSFQQDPPPATLPVDFEISGKSGDAMRVTARCGDIATSVESGIPLQAALKQPLTPEKLREQFGRLGGTAYHLETLTIRLDDGLILPVSELNRLRRQVVAELDKNRSGQIASPEQAAIKPRLQQILKEIAVSIKPVNGEPQLSTLCRSLEQIQSSLQCGIRHVYADFEDIRRYREAVALVRESGSPETAIFLATPRIQKAGEEGFFKLIEGMKPDGILIRNLGALSYFQNTTLQKIGDFSLNVANPLTAEVLMKEGFERLTISYDLNADQVLSLLRQAPAGWFELVLHQHMPMFHMEHCVFAAFLSNGTDHTNCGRPCDHHQIRLRDRVGAEHPVKADVGCRNTVFHQKAQTGAAFYDSFVETGLRHFRIEFLNEDSAQTRKTIGDYQLFIARKLDAQTLARQLKAQGQLGVTSGTLTVLQ